MKKFDFDPELARRVKSEIVYWIQDWFYHNGKNCNAICLMSGGKDSFIGTALIVDAIGADSVIGIGMPDTGQQLNDADKQADYLGIRFDVLSIEPYTKALCNQLPYSVQAFQNFPPRIRFALGMAYAQSANGRLAGFCNLSETMIGYETFGGDDLASFAPLHNLTVTEVKLIGRTMDLPSEWIDKIPDDGLPMSKPDEEKIGFKYCELDKYIRTGICDNQDSKSKIDLMIKSSSFKREIIHVPSYDPLLPNYLIDF